MTQNKTPAGQRPTPTIEDYLAEIYTMDQNGEPLIAARLAEAMAVSPPTVTVTLKRMERDGWITNDSPKGFKLTTTGLEAARSVVRRHMLTEWLLAKVLKVPWSKVHHEAHQIEHSISSEIEQQMLDNLDHPQVCPHGNPFPGYEAISEGWVNLAGVESGRQVIIRSVHENSENNDELMDYLERNGVVPGARALVCQNLACNETLSLDINGKTVVLGANTARVIEVETVS